MEPLEEPFSGDDFIRSKKLLAQFLRPGDTIYLSETVDPATMLKWYQLLLPGLDRSAKPVIYTITPLVGNITGHWSQQRKKLTFSSPDVLIHILAKAMAPEEFHYVGYYHYELI